MACANCKSDDQKSIRTETALHVDEGLYLTRPLVMIFPKLRVCLNCGHAECELTGEEVEEVTAAIHIPYNRAM